MNHEEMAAELNTALGRRIVFENVSIAASCQWLESMHIPPYIIQHLGVAMEAYQHGMMSGMNDNVETLSCQKPMTVGDFARKNADQLNPKAD